MIILSAIIGSTSLIQISGYYRMSTSEIIINTITLLGSIFVCLSRFLQFENKSKLYNVSFHRINAILNDLENNLILEINRREPGNVFLCKISQRLLAAYELGIPNTTFARSALKQEMKANNNDLSKLLLPGQCHDVEIRKTHTLKSKLPNSKNSINDNQSTESYSVCSDCEKHDKMPEIGDIMF
jgi:hypothetical protein